MGYRYRTFVTRASIPLLDIPFAIELPRIPRVRIFWYASINRQAMMMGMMMMFMMLMFIMMMNDVVDE